MTGDPVIRNMELITHHQPEEFGKGLKETPRVRPPPRIPLTSIYLGWGMRAPPGKTELEWLAKDHPETNPITIKPETASHVAEQFSWFPLPYCSPLGCPFPIKSLALSAHVSPQTIHFWVLDKSPVLDLGRGPSSCNKSTGMGCCFLLQRIFPTQGSNPGLPHYRQTLYHLSHQGGKPKQSKQWTWW